MPVYCCGPHAAPPAPSSQAEASLGSSYSVVKYLLVVYAVAYGLWVTLYLCQAPLTHHAARRWPATSCELGLAALSALPLPLPLLV